jgi:hypothetical protein
MCSKLSTVTEVNIGPLEIAKEFLGNASNYPPKLVDSLKQRLKEFLKVIRTTVTCHSRYLLKCVEDALVVNNSLIGPDQVKFQAELENGFKTLKTDLGKYL